LQIPDSEIQNSNSRFQIPDSRFQIPDSRFQISDFRFQISDFRFSNTKFRNLKNTGLATIPNSFGILNLEFGILKDNSNCESLGRFFDA
jgi:hypothetical protein